MGFGKADRSYRLSGGGRNSTENQESGGKRLSNEKRHRRGNETK